MADEQHIRGLLRHTWHAFYGRFGRLRPIQRAATEPICRGRDVLVGAPTASGKTEAVMAPVLERELRHLEREEKRRSESALAVLVITPTRALARDLHRRLEGPVEQCGLSVGVKTGDTSSLNYSDLPAVLTTTPESLDSLLCRHPKKLRDVSALILDELHLLDGSARGDQLQCLLRRCRQLQASEDLQICGASATLADGERLARTYLAGDGLFLTPASGRDGGASCDASSDHRSIDAELVGASTVEHAAEVIADTFRRGDARKLLVFANARSQVESLTAQLAEYPLLSDRVVSHHGSLSRAERLRAEKQLRDAPAGVCVATMTLEVGIDIGDVDRAILVGSPPDVSSLLQRIGRSNRRDDVTRVTCLYSSEFEKLRLTHLLECAAEGELFEEPVPFRPTVVPQQALSLMFQNPNRWIDAGALRARLSDSAQRSVSRGDCRDTLHQMVDDQVLHPMRRERFTAAEPAEKMYEYGQIHSNIEDDREVEVIDEMTRNVVGKVRFFETHRQTLNEGETLALSLGGEGREVVRMDDDQLVARSHDDLDGDEAQFIARLPPRYSRDLARDFAQFLGLPRRTMVVEERGDDLLLFHFLGTVWGELYERMLRNLGLVQRRGSHGAFFIRVMFRPDEHEATGEGWKDRYFRPDELRDHAEQCLASNRTRFMRLMGAGAHQHWLPDHVISDWLREAIDVARFVEVISEMTIEQRRILGGE
jgi:ATP-dependent Lhr-like helicase